MENLLISVFISILNMSITGSYVILAVMLIRLMLKRAPRKYSYLLWSVVGFRLCCPVSFESVFSLFRLRPFDMTAAQKPADHVLTYIPENIGMMETPRMTTGIPAANTLITGSMPDGVIYSLNATPQYSANSMQIWTAVGMYLWLIGIALLLIYAVVSCVLLHVRLRRATILSGNVWQSENVQSPFILGLVKPKIYIPYRLEEETLDYILMHERYHIRCLDHIVRPLAFLILTVHWFNPLCWLAFVLMGRDMEMRCDEWVLGQSDGIRKRYSTSLLSFAANRRFPSPTPLAFGETGVKGRIRNVLRWQKPKVWITVTALILCLAVLIACAANPAKNETKHDTAVLNNPFGRDYRISGTVYSAGAFSYVAPADDSADFHITLDGQFLRIAEESGVLHSWGTLTEITLTEDNFDDRIDTSVWAGQDSSANAEIWQHYGFYDSPADIREHNARAWIAKNDDPTFFCFLQQKDGTNIVCTSYGESIVWIYTVEAMGADGAYHSVKCVYMNPLSSTMGSDDSGYTYYLTDTYFAMVRDGSGDTVFTVDLEDTVGWQSFPYSVSEWTELFLPLGGSDYEFLRHGEWLKLSERYALWRKDDRMRIYNIHKDVGIWSAYDLEPGGNYISADDVVEAFLTHYPYPYQVSVTAWTLAPDTVWFDGFVLFTNLDEGTKCNIAAVDITNVDGENVVDIKIRTLEHLTRMEPADYQLRYLGNETVQLDILEDDGVYEYTVSFAKDNTSMYERVKKSPYPETMPDDFAVRFEMWIDVTQKNIFDTYDGYVQKDLVRNGIFGKQFEPTDEMMEEIYAKLVECDLASIRDEVTYAALMGGGASVAVEPNTFYQIRFTMNGKEYLVLGDMTSYRLPKAYGFKKFNEYMFGLMSEIQSELEFPEAEGGYM